MHKPGIFSSQRVNQIILPAILFLTLGIIFFQGKAEVTQQKDATKPAVTGAADDSAQRLLISVVKNEEVQVTTLSSPEADASEGKVLSCELESVDIQLDGVTKPLEKVLREGAVSFHEIMAWAALDAENGYCGVTAETKQGLTMFRYRYQEFDLSIFNDVYQTPDGKEHLIRECTFYPRSGSVSVRSIIFTDEHGIPLNLEDWGITLETLEITPTGATFLIHQSGGQQIGQLVASDFRLLSQTEKKVMLEENMEISLNMDGSTTVTWDWAKSRGALPKGTYLLGFCVEDLFDPAQKHPLMLDFRTLQGYEFSFEIS